MYLQYNLTTVVQTTHLDASWTNLNPFHSHEVQKSFHGKTKPIHVYCENRLGKK